MINIRNIAAFFISAISIVFIMIIGKGILVPFVFAIILWFIVRSMVLFMNRVKFIKNIIPMWIKTLLSFLFILFLLNFILSIVSKNAVLLANSLEKYEDSF